MKRQQHGAAILTAMLVVVLVATLASAMLWQQWRSFEAESAQRTRSQAYWILTGALDWSRLILREDARQGGADHLSEPWAVPLAPARLSTFLAAEGGQAVVDDDEDAVRQTFLSGRIEDLQARLNLTNLIGATTLTDPALAAWTRLFKHLNLPERELQTMLQSLKLAQAYDSAAGKSEASLPLSPSRVEDLGWLGLSPLSLQVLRPFITLLPATTTVNLNTAAAEVLLASVPGMDMAQAQALVQLRATHPMAALADAERLLNNPSVRFDASLHGISSRYFGVTGQLKVGQTVVQEHSVLQRDSLDVKTITRAREVVTAPFAPLQ
mgnify:CR=1 FL=1